MEALLVVGTLLQVVGTLSAGEAQASALERQADMYMKQASIYSAQIETDRAENDRRIAVEKAAIAQEALMRTEKLQRIIGSTIAAGAKAGISTQYGSITRLNEESSYQASIEEAISRDNSNNRIVSLNLNSAINEQNLANQAYGSVFQANEAHTEAANVRFQSYVSAASSLVSFGMGQANRGSAPNVQVADGFTSSKGYTHTYYPNSGEMIRWN